jgi:hypothetical protein
MTYQTLQNHNPESYNLNLPSHGNLSCPVYIITFFISMTFNMMMATALFAKSLEERKK